MFVSQNLRSQKEYFCLEFEGIIKKFRKIETASTVAL